MPDAVLDVAGLKAGLVGAGEYLRENYRILDNLNVFPVPDGDTGTNMLTTYRAGVDRIHAAEVMADVAEQMNESMTRQSRGNSGFILARFFHGFFEVTGRAESIGLDDLREAFARGSYSVNTSLFAPVEGTMITVIAAMAEALRRAGNGDVRAGLRAGLEAGRRSVFETPRLLKILARAGVVDAGALGFLFLMEGFGRGLTNEKPEIEREEVYRFPPDQTAGTGIEDTGQMHRYCTEVLLRPGGPGTADGPQTPDLDDFLKSNGNSIALVNQDSLIKVHIHTDDPERVVRYLETLGTIENTKIEDMQAQMGLFAAEEDPESVNALLVCVPGPGFREIVNSLGIADCIVYTNELPPTATLLEAVQANASRNITILPNNKNILPTAMLARDRSDKNVSILPTENIIEGLASLYGYSENASVQENITNMAECMHMAESLFLYRAAADVVFDTTEIPRGAFFCVHDGNILAVNPDPVETALVAMRGRRLEEKANICLYHGTSEGERTAREIRDRLAAEHPAVEVECLFGGQPREHLIISLE